MSKKVVFALGFIAGILSILAIPVVLAHSEDVLMMVLQRLLDINSKAVEELKGIRGEVNDAVKEIKGFRAEVKVMKEKQQEKLKKIERNQIKILGAALNSPVFEIEDMLITNILTQRNKEVFRFAVSHPNPVWGDIKNVSDEVDRRAGDDWNKYGFQIMPGKDEGWWKVDLFKPYRARYIVIVGYPEAGTHYPQKWWLDGSNTSNDWTEIHEFFPASGEKPPVEWHIVKEDGKSWNDVKDNPKEWVKINKPGYYRYYRLRGKDWKSPYMLIMNIGLFVEVEY